MTEAPGAVRAPARFRRRRAEGCTIVSAAGDLDSDAAQGLKHELDLAITEGLFVVVDVSDARVIDDSARELLDGMNNLLRAFGGRLSVITSGASSRRRASEP